MSSAWMNGCSRRHGMAPGARRSPAHAAESSPVFLHDRLAANEPAENAVEYALHEANVAIWRWRQGQP